VHARSQHGEHKSRHSQQNKAANLSAAFAIKLGLILLRPAAHQAHAT